MAILGLDTTIKKVVFLSYLGLWCCLRLFVYGSQHGEHGGAYSPAALLVLTTVMKLAMSLVSWWTIPTCAATVADRDIQSNSPHAMQRRLNLFVRYFLPAASYVVYDNMMFFCLERLDPVTYVILMQLRLPVTAITWQSVFGRRLSIVQWGGLVMVMSACMLQRSTAQQNAGDGKGGYKGELLLGFAGVVVQIGCGVFSSVYNEFMLKKGDISVHLQNVFMYTHSLACNIVWIVASGQAAHLRPTAMLQLFNSTTLPIATLLASIGIVTSLFLKHLDSVRKGVASAIELFGDALLSWWFFSIAVKWPTFGAMFLCAAGIVVCFNHSTADATANQKATTTNKQ